MAEQILKKRIMRRVYAVWALKKLTSPIFMKFLILVGSVRLSFSMVSIPNILHNLPPSWDLSANYRFLTAAFWHTDSAVKLISIMILGTALWLIQDLLSRSLILAMNQSDGLRSGA